jgi:hypothetical protein
MGTQMDRDFRCWCSSVDIMANREWNSLLNTSELGSISMHFLSPSCAPHVLSIFLDFINSMERTSIEPTCSPY